MTVGERFIAGGRIGPLPAAQARRLFVAVDVDLDLKRKPTLELDVDEPPGMGVLCTQDRQDAVLKMLDEVTVGLTAGASTPNNVVGEVVERLLALRGRSTAELLAG